ncbi:TRPM8-like protein, partial [Mya arenaria]
MAEIKYDKKKRSWETVFKGSGRTQYGFRVSSEEEMRRKVRTQPILQKPGTILSFSTNTSVKDRTLRHFLAKFIVATGSILTAIAPTDNDDFLKKVVKDVQLETNHLPSSIVILPEAEIEDIFKEEKRKNEIPAVWSHFTLLIACAKNFNQLEALACLNDILIDQLSNIPTNTPVLVVVYDIHAKHKSLEQKAEYSSTDIPNYEIFVEIKNRKQKWEASSLSPHSEKSPHKWNSGCSYYTSRLIKCLITAAVIFPVRTIINMVVSLDSGIAIVDVMEQYKHQFKVTAEDKLYIIADALERDEWMQVKGLLIEEKNNSELWDVLLDLFIMGEKASGYLTRNSKDFRNLLSTVSKGKYEKNEKVKKECDKATGKDTSLSSCSRKRTMQNKRLCIFLWAICAKRFTVAKAIWRWTGNLMTAALMASKLLQDIKANTTVALDVEQIEEMVEFYDGGAISIFKKCARVKSENAKNILIRKRTELGQDESVLQIAKKNKTFISHDVCKPYMDEIWYFPLDQNPHKLAIFVCLFLPFLAPLWLDFSKVSDNGGNAAKQRQPSYKKKMKSDLMFDVSEFTWGDGVVIAFVIAFAAGEINQWHTQREEYLKNGWNRLDLLSLGLFITGQCLAHTCCSNVGRVLLAFSFITFSIRLLQGFTSISTIGPLLIMIKRMFGDMLNFIGVLAVVVISYAVAMRAILYPGSTFSWTTLYITFNKPFWNIFGELFLDDFEGLDESNLVNGTLHTQAPFIRYLSPVLLGMYMFIVQILLLNLLIAIFNFTVNDVHEDATRHAALQRLQLLLEYDQKHIASVPFNFVYVGILIYETITSTSSNTQNSDEINRSSNVFCRILKAFFRSSNEFSVRFPAPEDKQLKRWEGNIAKKWYDSVFERRFAVRPSVSDNLGHVDLHINPTPGFRENIDVYINLPNQ